MATSNSRDFTLNRNQIIQDSFEDAGIYGSSETISDADLQKASRVLNKMVKSLGARGYNLWNKKEAILFLQDNTSSYSINNSSSSAHCTENYVSTTLSASAALGAGTVTLTSVTGMTVNDNIGIELDNGTRQWTTITNINSGTKVVTLNAVLTGAAASGNTVVTYTNRINRPLRVTNARNFSLIDSFETTVELISHEDYFELPNKTTQGQALQAHYSKQLSAGIMYVFLTPDGVKNQIKFTYLDAAEDLDNPNDNADFPDEWLEALTAGLAYRLAIAYGQLINIEQLKKWADETLKSAKESDNEDVSIQFKMNPRLYN